MTPLLGASQALVVVGLLLSLAAAVLGGPEVLTLFLTVGQGLLLVGVVLYIVVVVRDLREKKVL